MTTEERIAELIEQLINWKYDIRTSSDGWGRPVTYVDTPTRIQAEIKRLRRSLPDERTK